VNHKVKDYDVWKLCFDADENQRLRSGIELNKIFRSVHDNNDIHLLFEAPEAEAAHKFFRAPRLKQLMLKAGVISKPEIRILELV
jgi:hypothetical protein